MRPPDNCSSVADITRLTSPVVDSNGNFVYTINGSIETAGVQGEILPVPPTLSAIYIRSYRAYFGTLLIKPGYTLCKVFKCIYIYLQKHEINYPTPNHISPVISLHILMFTLPVAIGILIAHAQSFKNNLYG